MIKLNEDGETFILLEDMGFSQDVLKRAVSYTLERIGDAGIILRLYDADDNIINMEDK